MPSPENGNTQAETGGGGNNRDCTCMGKDMCGAAWARGATQGGGMPAGVRAGEAGEAVWAGVRVGDREALAGEAA